MPDSFRVIDIEGSRLGTRNGIDTHPEPMMQNP